MMIQNSIIKEIMREVIKMNEKVLAMKLLDEKFAVCRLDKGASVPEWALKSSFYSVTKTSDELSVVCSEDAVPSGVKCESGWRILKVLGPLDFSLIGIISSISSVLADRKISIFAVSTYDTDYILVKDSYIGEAVSALTEKGYEIIYGNVESDEV
jgi:hypothetical protein